MAGPVPALRWDPLVLNSGLSPLLLLGGAGRQAAPSEPEKKNRLAAGQAPA